ncbi:hypothetical protein ACP4OV_012514 [Aristida adscensionis]
MHFQARPPLPQESAAANQGAAVAGRRAAAASQVAAVAGRRAAAARQESARPPLPQESAAANQGAAVAGRRAAAASQGAAEASPRAPVARQGVAVASPRSAVARQGPVATCQGAAAAVLQGAPASWQGAVVPNRMVEAALGLQLAELLHQHLPCGPNLPLPMRQQVHGGLDVEAAARVLLLMEISQLHVQPHFSPPPPPPQFFSENSHFVGFTNNLNPTSPAPQPFDKGTQTQTVNIDDDDGVEASKSLKKRYWTHDEEVRLASAWLNISKDPIHGNDKKSDSFWGQITEEFNKNSQPDRIRDTNQLKIHWSRLSRTINEFNGYWASVCKMNKSGYSDDQIMEEAQQMYKKKHSKPFQLIHWWKILRNEPKWSTHAAQSEKEKSKRIDVDLSDDKDVPRPMGREAAKKERKGKRKAEQILDGIAMLGDNISKIIDLTQGRKKEREVVTESNLQIARDQKEAKWVETYNLLLAKDTSNMSEEAKAKLEKTLQRIEKKIFGTDED